MTPSSRSVPKVTGAIGNWVMTPGAGSIFPIAPDWVNQRLPSGPAVIPEGIKPEVERGTPSNMLS